MVAKATKAPIVIILLKKEKSFLENRATALKPVKSPPVTTPACPSILSTYPINWGLVKRI